MPRCVITAAGLGKRSGLDGKFRKEMLPVYDFRDGGIVLRPIIDCIITHLMKSGIDDFIVVLDPGDSVTQNYLSSEFRNIKYVYQEKKAGFGDAVSRSSQILEGDSFLLNAGDGLILDMEFLNFFVQKVLSDPQSNHLCLMHVDDPDRYGTAEYFVSGDHMEIVSVVEKSHNPPSNLALCAFYYLTDSVMKNIERTGTNIELTPAINKSIEEGVPTHGYIIDKSKWISVGVSESYIEVLKRSLDYARSRL
ncbi:sugar phosphate nucleotidyltransferase [Oxyplasma meridianum]|uniref:UTP--glucose-1-phosphate uridylyltransferase n=1 Tax=Oxyplasma meridianum TaxID=3073602 RepID=A0AAX4NIM0_9ARCH